MTNLKKHKLLKDLFNENFRDYKELNPVSISSKIDPSVYFIGSGFSVFKQFLCNDAQSLRIIQPCFRSRNLIEFKQQIAPSYSSYFISPSVITKGEEFQRVLNSVLDIHSQISKLKIIIKSYNGDTEIHELIAKASVKDRVEIQYEGNKNVFRHYYGIDGMEGQNINLCIKYSNGKESRTFCNVVLIKYFGKYFVDFGTGVSTYLSVIEGVSSSIYLHPIVDLICPIYSKHEILLLDSLLSVYHITESGVKPLATKRGRVLRSYLVYLLQSCKLLRIDTSYVYELLSLYEEQILRTNTHYPMLIYDYCKLRLSYDGKPENINKYLAKNTTWLKN